MEDREQGDEDGIEMRPEPPLRLPGCRVCGQNPVDPDGERVCGCCLGRYEPNHPKEDPC